MHGNIDTKAFAGAVTVGLLILLLVYTRGWLDRRRTSPIGGTPPSTGWHVSAFGLGLAAVWIAIAAPAVGSGHVRLTFHMAQHLLVGAIAPPLIWFSAPIAPILAGVPQWLCRMASAPISKAALERTGHGVTQPYVAWFAGVLTVVGWHVPAAVGLAQHSPFWHSIRMGSFFVSGLLFWWPVVEPWPSSARLPRAAVPLYLFAATLPCDALSAFLVFCDRLVYQQPDAAPVSLASALADQQTAGALMWVSITFIYLVPALISVVRSLSPERPGGDARAVSRMTVGVGHYVQSPGSFFDTIARKR